MTGTLRNCLCGDSPAIEALEAVKEWANIQRASRSQALPGELASAIYYGAIAAALVRCDKKITGLNDQALASGLGFVHSLDWLDESIRATIGAAIERVNA